MTGGRGFGVIGVGWALLLGGCHEPNVLTRIQSSVIMDRGALDFGEVPVGEWREATVRVRNNGYVEVRANEVQALFDEPAFVVEMPKARIRGGEELEVTVKFHPLREGKAESAYQVDTNADSKPGPFRMEGMGTPARLKVRPERLDFQTLEKDSHRDLDFEVENPTDLPLSVAVVGDGTQGFETDLINIPPLTTQTVRTRFAPTDLGPRAAQVQLRACLDCTPTVVNLTGQAVPSALIFDPDPVSFQHIPVHEKTQSKTRVTNIIWRRVDLTALSPNDDAFKILDAPLGQGLAPGQSADISMEFSARASGPSTGNMVVDYLSDRARSRDLLLDARAGRPQLSLTPVQVDFGSLPVGGKTQAVIRLSNAGSSGNLLFKGVRLEGAGAGQFDVSVPYRGAAALSWTSGSAHPNYRADDLPIAAGSDALDVRVFFQPAASGPFTATLVFESDDMFSPERTVTVQGTAYDSGDCSFRVLPAGELDFGNVPPGTGAVLGFRFENTGTNACAVKDIRLLDDGDGAFFMPGGALTGGVIIQNDGFSAQIAFRATEVGTYQGTLAMTVSGGTGVSFTLPLKAVAAPSCLVAVPNYLDFGPIRYDCAPKELKTYLSNRCDTPLDVRWARIGAGTSAQFKLENPPTFPRTLAPGAGFELTASYARNVHGQHYSPLFVMAAGESEPFLVPLLAETNHQGQYLERFVQGVPDQLDLLFLVSNTSTMEPYQERLKAAVPGLINQALGGGVDVRVGVTTTGLVERSATCPGGAQGGEAGRLFPVDGSRARTVSSTNPNAGALIQQNLSVGVCHNLVQGLETLRSAVSPPLSTSADDPRTQLPNDGNAGFLRSAARLGVVVLSDEDDHSGFEPDGYVQALRALKGPGMGHRTQLWAIVPTNSSCRTAGPDAPRFSAVARGTGGSTFEVCAQDYGPLLAQVLQRARGAQQDFPLQHVPDAPDAMVVKVNNVQQDPAVWDYDPARNAIVFDPGSVPPPGTSVTVRYRGACTN